MVTGIAVLLRTPWHSWGDDFAAYLLQAHAMAAGKMGTEALLNGSLVAASDSYPAPAAYPWGFPTLLWLGSRIGGWELMPLKVVGGFSLGAAAAFTFMLSRSFLPRSASVLAAALVGLQPELLQSSDLVLSDLPFLAVVGVALYHMDRSYRAIIAGESVRAAPWLAAALTIAAFAIRVNGVAVAGTFMLMHGYLWVATPGRRVPILRSGALYVGAAVVLVALYFAWLPGQPIKTYATLIVVTLRSVLDQAAQNGLLVSAFVPFTFLPGNSSILTVVGVGVCACLVVLGAWVRRPFALGLALFGLLNLGLLLIFPFVQGPRYLYPLLIPGAILALCGVHYLWGSPHNPLRNWSGVTRRIEAAAPWLVGALATLMAVYGYGITHQPTGYQLDGPYSAASQELTHFIFERLPPDARIAFYRPRALRLLTGRPVIAIRTSEKAGRMTYFVLKKGLTPDSREFLAMYQLGAEYFKEHAAEFERLFENGQFVVYHRLPVHP